MADGGFNWADVLPQAKDGQGNDMDMNELMDQRVDEMKQPFEAAGKGLEEFGKAAGDFLDDRREDLSKGIEQAGEAFDDFSRGIAQGVSEKASEISEGASRAMDQAGKDLGAYNASHSKQDAYDRDSFGLS